MKKFRAILALSAMSILVPAGVAKTSMTLQKLSLISQSNDRPTEFTMKLNGSYDDYAGTVTITGVQSGIVAKKPVQGSVRIDASMQSKQGGKARVALEARLIGENLYVKVNDLVMTGFPDNGIHVDEYESLLHVWIRIPLEKEQLEALSEKGRTERSSELKRYEQYFDITETVRSGVHHYEVTLSKTKMRRLLTAVTAETRKYSTAKLNAELRRSLRMTTLSFDAFVDVLSDGRFDASDVKISYTTILNKKKATFSFVGAAKTVAEPVLTTPEGSRLLEDILEGMDNGSSSQLEDARNAQRRADVNTILNAVYQYAIDNNARFPTGITTVETEICRKRIDAKDAAMTCDGLVDLSVLTESYLVNIPSDPVAATQTSSKYTIMKDAQGRITVSAPAASGDKKISVTR